MDQDSKNNANQDIKYSKISQFINSVRLRQDWAKCMANYFYKLFFIFKLL